MKRFQSGAVREVFRIVRTLFCCATLAGCARGIVTSPFRSFAATLAAAMVFLVAALSTQGSPTMAGPALPPPALLAVHGPFARMLQRAGYKPVPRAFPAGRALLLPGALELPLYNFGAAPDVSGAATPLIADAAGALYGTSVSGGAFGNGTVFKLSPPAPGLTAWTETILYSFTGGADGGFPYASLIFDKLGALYGTANGGGAPGFGTAFKLTPPAVAGGSWTESVLYAFTGGADGAYPEAALVPINGELYSTASYGGTFNLGALLKLTPPASPQGAWTETTLFSFGGPADGANPYYNLVYTGGALISTLYAAGPSTRCGFGCGTVVALTPPPGGVGTWTETVLHAFNGIDGSGPEQIVESGGVLYGITNYGGGGGSHSCYFQGCGAVFELKPTHGTWTEKTLLALDGADGYAPSGIAVDNHGNLHGSTYFGGVYGFGNVFKLTQRAGAWHVSVMHAFACGADSGTPLALSFLNGGLFGTTAGGTACGNGQVFQLR